MDGWSLLKLSPLKQSHYLELLRTYQPDIVSYYPEYRSMARPHGMRRAMEIVRPVYPGYIFIRVDASTDLCRLVQMPVRAMWVRFGGRVEVVPGCVVERLRELEGANELVKEIKYASPFRSGVSVRVHLPVYDLVGIVVKLVSGNRAVVDTQLCRVTVPVHTMEVM